MFQATITSTCVDTKADAKAIVESKFDPKVIAKILPRRTLKERIEINKEITSLNGGVSVSHNIIISIIKNS